MFREDVAAYYRKRGYAIKENVKVRAEDGTVYAVDMVAQSTLGNLLIAFEDEGGFEGPEMNAVRRMARAIGATPVVAAAKIPAGLRKQAAGAGVVLVDEDTVFAPEEEDVLPEPSGDPEYPPWPGSGKGDDSDEPAPWPRAQPRSGRMEARDVDSVVSDLTQDAVRQRKEKSTDPGIWQFPRQGVEAREVSPATTMEEPAKSGDFGWLPKESNEIKEREPEAAAPRPDYAARRAARLAATEPAPTRSPVTPARTKPWVYVVMAAVFGATASGVFYALLRLVG